MDQPYGEQKTQSSSPNFDELSRNMARFIEGASKATAAYLKPTDERQTPLDYQAMRRKSSRPWAMWPNPG
jgi:polyhydroxyalkanoate synthase subunit PhaC